VELHSFSRQRKLPAPSCSSSELAAAAFSLFKRSYHWNQPIRSIGLRGADLVEADNAVQLSLFRDDQRKEKRERLDQAVEQLRERFGYSCVKRAVLLADPVLGAINPKDDHTVHPVGYF